MVDVHSDDTLTFLLEKLSRVAPPARGRGSARSRETHGSDVWILQVATEFWASRGQKLSELEYDDRDRLAAPFYDAAWALCRQGVLRPGAAFPAGQTAALMGQELPSSPFFGDGFSLTVYGREWLKRSVAERHALPADQNRLTTMLLQFRDPFGDGYGQRAAEAVKDWWSGNYLSACTMAGAAAESILLAVAIAKIGDEKKVLLEYQSSKGRSRLIGRVVGK
jgi:hypothetical protein